MDVQMIRKFESQACILDNADGVTVFPALESTPDFWGIYARKYDGMFEHIGDCQDEASADAIRDMLNAMLTGLNAMYRTLGLR